MTHPFKDVTALSCLAGRNVGKIIKTGCTGFELRDIHTEDDPSVCLSTFNHIRPDIVFVYLNGNTNDRAFELITNIRDQFVSHNPFVPTIAISGHLERGLVMKAIETGFHEFVGLPLSAKALWRATSHAIFVGRPFVRVGNYFGPCRRRRVDDFYSGTMRRGEDLSGEQSQRLEQEERMDKIMNEWESAA